MAVILLNDHRPQGTTLQVAAFFTYKLTTTAIVLTAVWDKPRHYLRLLAIVSPFTIR